MRRGRRERPARSRRRAHGPYVTVRASVRSSSALPSHVEPQRPFGWRQPAISTMHALYAGKITMRVVAGVILEPHVVALVIGEARLPVPLIHLRIVDRDDVF